MTVCTWVSLILWGILQCFTLYYAMSTAQINKLGSVLLILSSQLQSGGEGKNNHVEPKSLMYHFSMDCNTWLSSTVSNKACQKVLNYTAQNENYYADDNKLLSYDEKKSISSDLSIMSGTNLILRFQILFKHISGFLL